MISSAQCRAARALLNWPLDQLAGDSGVPEADITLFEAGSELPQAQIDQLEKALEKAGAFFIREGRGRGPGVRFRFSRVSVKRMDIWENEGGPTGEDDVT